MKKPNARQDRTSKEYELALKHGLTSTELATKFGLPEARVLRSLRILKRFQVVKEVDGKWYPNET